VRNNAAHYLRCPIAGGTLAGGGLEVPIWCNNQPAFIACVRHMPATDGVSPKRGVGKTDHSYMTSVRMWSTVNVGRSKDLNRQVCGRRYVPVQGVSSIHIGASSANEFGTEGEEALLVNPVVG